MRAANSDFPTENSTREIVIFGLCRDVALDLENDVRRLRESFSDFKIHFRFVESDSSDSTIEILGSLARNYESFRFISLGELAGDISERVERITFCRNKYLEILEEDEALSRCEYVVVSDLDGVNVELTRKAVTSCWERDDWDACMANQRAPYYDIYALRHPKWSPNDCWHYEAELRAKGFNPVRARNRAIYARQIRIPEDSAWIRVDSAFGGLAIYRRALFTGIRYSSRLTNGDHVCEHVTLHAQMLEKGARLFINPQLINCGWNVHNSSNRFSKRIKRGVKLVLWVILPNLRKKYF